MKKKAILITLLFVIFQSNSYSQVDLRVVINSGTSSTNCTDGFFEGAPEPHWSVEIENQGITVYPRAGTCFTDTPNTQFFETYNCPSDYPDSLLVCFSAFEDDGTSCVVSQSCLETICKKFATPSPQENEVYTLTFPYTGESFGSVDFTIVSSGSFITSTGIDIRTECNSYTWIDGNTYTLSNNTATHNIVGGASNGCDSLVTLDLTIINPTSGTDTRVECDSFTWIDGNTYTLSNNTATHNIVGGASNGCDSLVTLDLTINQISNITTSVNGSTVSSNNNLASYQWLDCNNNYAIQIDETEQSFTPVNSGSYAVELTENGCVDTTDCVIIETTSLEENSLGRNTYLYPNPTDRDFTLYLGDSFNKGEIFITDLFGKIIHYKKINQTKSYDFSLNGPIGIYIITINSGNEKAVFKLVKQ